MDPTAPKSPNSPNLPNSDPDPVTSEPIDTPFSPPPDPSGKSSPYTEPPKQDVYATSLDPNDPFANRAQPNQAPADSSIQTGQFVVAGGDQTPLQPAPNFEPTVAPPPPPTPSSPSTSVFTSPYAPQQPGTLAAEAPLSVPQSITTPAPDSAPATQPFQSQPDPTPYAPPPPTPGSQQVSGGGSMIKKLRLVAIIAGVLVLLGAIAALIWFFVLGRTSSQPTQAQTPTQETQAVVDVPTPLPKRTEGGFGTLPGLQSTNSAQVATPSAQ